MIFCIDDCHNINYKLNNMNFHRNDAFPLSVFRGKIKREKPKFNEVGIAYSIRFALQNLQSFFGVFFYTSFNPFFEMRYFAF